MVPLPCLSQYSAVVAADVDLEDYLSMAALMDEAVVRFSNKRILLRSLSGRPLQEIRNRKMGGTHG
jgi:hypothetical protein